MGEAPPPDSHVANSRPGLAVVYTPQVLTLQMVEAARGDWHILWLVDRDLNDLTGSMRVLNRLGTVVDITGLDYRECAERLRALDADGIIAFAEWELLRTAQIGAELGFEVNPPDTARCLTNKYLQRQALQAAGLPGPGFWAVSADADANARAEVVKSVGFPAIVKPQEGFGSHDVFRVTDSETLADILDANARREQPASLLVEDALTDGWSRDEHPYADFVSVESIVARGRVSHLAITGRATLQEPFVETGNFIPSNMPQEAAGAVVEMAERAIMAIGARTGVFHTEIKLTPAGPCVIEINGRVGGSIPELLGLATDNAHSLLRIACQVALGEDVAFDQLLPCSRVGYSLRVPPPIGATRLLRLDHLDMVSRTHGVVNVEAMRRPGDPVDWRDGWDGCIYFVYGAAESHEQMWLARQQITDTVELEFA